MMMMMMMNEAHIIRCVLLVLDTSAHQPTLVGDSRSAQQRCYILSSQLPSSVGDTSRIVTNVCCG